MIVNVTPLGYHAGGELTGTDTAIKIVSYLEGGVMARPGRQAGQRVELPSPEGGVVSYYADASDARPGEWVLGRRGSVEPVELARLLAGIGAPDVDVALTPRRRRGRELSVLSCAKDWFSAKEAASYLPLSDPELVSGVTIDFTVEAGAIEVTTRVEGTTSIGARMHALSAATVAALTIYDMCKSADRTMQIGPVTLVDPPSGATSN